MDKRAVIRSIVRQIEKDLAGLIAATKATHAEATDEQNKPENKYDTRALEASYLAQGQSRQVAELEKAIEEFAALGSTDVLPDAMIEVGTLLALKRGKTESFYFLGPRAGGMEVALDGETVTVITPQSPIGRQLLGKARGEAMVLPNDPEQKPFKIIRIW